MRTVFIVNPMAGKKRNIDKISDVFIASFDFNDGFYIQVKGEEDIKR